MSLTEEQSNVIEHARTVISTGKKDMLFVNAVAGSGKTHLLTAMVNSIPHEKGIYLAYNKSIAVEAAGKFPSSINCLTVNALAYRNVVYALGLKVGHFSFRDMNEKLNYDVKIAYVEYLRDFCLSKYTSIEEWGKDQKFEDFQINILKKYMELMYKGTIPCTHDFYLKIFHIYLAEGMLNFPEQDFLLLDEAGDVNEVILEIFKLIPAKVKVAVGDNNQNIYAFNKTINAFSVMEGNGTFFNLTKSFRVSDQIAARIEHFCKKYIDPDMRFTGIPVKDATITTRGFISRTNSGLISAIIELNSQGIDYNLVRDPAEVFKLPLILCFLKHNGTITDPAYAHLQSDVDDWYSDQNLMQKYKSPASYLQSLYPEDLNLSSAVRLMMNIGRKKLLETYELAKQKNNKSAKVFLGTAHSVKGLEFDEVVIMEDLNRVVGKFLEQGTLEDDNALQEMNLYYVAASRAKKSLQGAIYL